jgi:hypothetical protein
MGLGGFNDTSLPWPLKSSTHFAEHPAHYPHASKSQIESAQKTGPYECIAVNRQLAGSSRDAPLSA